MIEIVQSILAAILACSFVVVLSFALANLQLLCYIRKYNKTHTEHQLDERTSLGTYNSRFRDWQLEMFCNEKKGNTTNEK